MAAAASNRIQKHKVADDQWARYVRARDTGHLDWVEQAQKFNKFYQGEQWKETDLADLAVSGRPALTINTILPTINTVLGEQATKRSEIQFKPKRGASHETAQTLNRLYKHTSDDIEYDYLESQVFSDGLIQDRGFFNLRIDFSDNIQGEVMLEAEDPVDILIDPDAKEYDPETWVEVFKTKWKTLDEIELTYGKKKAEEVRDTIHQSRYYGMDSVDFRETRFGSTETVPGSIRDVENGYISETETHKIRSVRIVERQHRTIQSVDFFVDLMHGDMKKCPETWDEERRQKFAQTYKLGIVPREVKRIRWTVTADRIVLFDDWSPYDFFTIIPYFPYFRRGRPFGMVKNLISPQEQLNKISSQELHVVNTTANSGWMVPTGSLLNMTLDELETRGSKTGTVVEYNPTIGEPTKIQSNDIPAGLDRISMKAAMNIKEISGVTAPMMGQDTGEQSGVAINARNARSQVQIQIPLDNLAKTRKMVADRILLLFQQFYTEERTFYIANDSMNREPGSEEFQELIINQKMAGGQIVNNITVGKYDVTVSNQPAKDIYNDTQFEEALELRQIGVAIPDDVVVEYSNLGKKYDLAERIRKDNGQGEMTPEQQAQAQMMQELQMKEVQLNLDELEAKVEKLQTASALDMARAQDLEGGGDANRQLKEVEMIAKDSMNVDDNETKLQLQEMKERAELLLAQLDSATRIKTSEMRSQNKSAPGSAQANP